MDQSLDFYFDGYLFIHIDNAPYYDMSCVRVVKKTKLYFICEINKWTIWASGKKPDEKILSLLPDEKLRELSELREVDVRFTDKGVYVRDKEVARAIARVLKRRIRGVNGWFKIPKIGLVVLPKMNILPRFSVDTKITEKIDFKLKFKLRNYQQQAYAMFRGRGLVTWATGAGKSFLAIALIKKMGVPTLIVVPSIDLANEWFSKFEKYTDAVDRGLVCNWSISRAKRELKPITIMPYRSAVLYLPVLRKRFKFLVFDEAHHAPANSYIRVASAFPYILSLTASPYREDHREHLIYGLSGGGLASIEWERFYKDEIISRPKVYFVQMDKNILLEFVKRKHKHDKVLIFIFQLEHIDVVKRIFKNALVIYGRMSPRQRKLALEIFKQKRNGVMIVSIVGDEGIDIPDANVGVIYSSLGGRREAVQRVGRLLRPKNKRPIIYYPYDDFDKIRDIAETFRNHGFEVHVI